MRTNDTLEIPNGSDAPNHSAVPVGVMSHTRAVPSPPPVSSSVPSGLNEMSPKPAVCPANRRICNPVVASQIRAVPSLLPVARNLPSELQSIPATLVCPTSRSSGSVISDPPAERSHTLASSSFVVARCVPSGLNTSSAVPPGGSMWVTTLPVVASRMSRVSPAIAIRVPSG